MLPRILLCTLILSGVVLAVGIFGNKMMSTDNKAISADIDVVLPQNDVEVLLAYQLYVNMDSISSVAVCRPTFDEAVAFMHMREGDSAGIAIIPFGFVDGILNGTNVPARFILPHNAGIETMMFCSVINAGIKSLAYVQSAIYAITDVIIEKKLGNDALNNATDYLNDINIEYAEKRSSFYNHISLSSTGENGVSAFYLASGIVLLMILCGLSVVSIFSENPPAILDAMKTNRISKGYIRFGEYFSIGLIFTILFVIVDFVAGHFVDKSNFKISFSGIMAFVILAYSVVAFIMFICMITDRGLISTLVIFLLAIVMIYASGRILPSVFLPDTVADIGAFMPTKFWGALLESININKIDFAALRGTLLYGAAFLAASIGLTYLRREAD